jgi:hypothetical protein
MNKFILAISLALAVPAFAAEPAKEPAKKAAPAKKAETAKKPEAPKTPEVHCDLKKDPKCKDVTKKPLTKEEREAKKKAKEAAAQK